MASISDELFCVHLLSKPQSDIGKILTARANCYIRYRLVQELHISIHNNKLKIEADIIKHIHIKLLWIKGALSLALLNEKNIEVSTPFQELIQSP